MAPVCGHPGTDPQGAAGGARGRRGGHHGGAGGGQGAGRDTSGHGADQGDGDQAARAEGPGIRASEIGNHELEKN